jgi:hypothetical protein
MGSNYPGALSPLIILIFLPVQHHYIIPRTASPLVQDYDKNNNSYDEEEIYKPMSRMLYAVSPPPCFFKKEYRRGKEEIY